MHDLIRYGTEYVANTELAQLGMFAGLAISFLGLLVGSHSDGAPDESQSTE